jgi:hypothetical protein
MAASRSTWRLVFPITSPNCFPVQIASALGSEIIRKVNVSAEIRAAQISDTDMLVYGATS